MHVYFFIYNFAEIVVIFKFLANEEETLFHYVAGFHHGQSTTSGTAIIA